MTRFIPSVFFIFQDYGYCSTLFFFVILPYSKPLIHKLKKCSIFVGESSAEEEDQNNASYILTLPVIAFVSSFI